MENNIPKLINIISQKIIKYILSNIYYILELVANLYSLSIIIGKVSFYQKFISRVIGEK